MGYVYVCGYGTRHKLNTRCNCKYKYKCFDFQLVDWIEENLKEFKNGKWVKVKIDYPSDIKRQRQHEFLQNNK